MPASATELDKLAENLGIQARRKNPIVEQALRRGLSEQVSAVTEEVESAAGITGASQVSSSASLLLQALGQGGIASEMQRIENESALLQLQSQTLGQAGQLHQQKYEADLKHEQFLKQLAYQKSMANKNLMASIAGGAVSAAAGGWATGAAGIDMDEIKALLAGK